MTDAQDSPVAVEAWWRKAWEVAPRHVRTRDWAERHIVILPPSTRPEPLRLITNPMLDLMDHPDVRETAGRKGVQTDISQALQIRVTRRAHTSPCEMLLVLPSQAPGIQQMKQRRWKPILSGKGARSCDSSNSAGAARGGRGRRAAAGRRRPDDERQRRADERLRPAGLLGVGAVAGLEVVRGGRVRRGR